MSADHDFVMTKYEIFTWKYNKLIFAISYVIVTSPFKTVVFT